MQQQTPQIALDMIENRMYMAILNLPDAQQSELRALADAQPLPALVKELQQRFSQYADYITPERVSNVIAHDRDQRRYSLKPVQTNQPTAQAPVPSPATLPQSPQLQMPAQAPVSTTQVQQVKARHWWNDGALFMHGFVRSNYITAVEDWMMGLAGKLVNIALMITVLYSCAEIYMTLPQNVNATMFLIQMAALDVGGYGLTTLARMAQRDDNLSGAKQANWLGGGLIVVMLVSVMIAGLEQKITIPDGLKAGIDIALILIRSACSVFYGRVVHALKIDHNAHAATHEVVPDLQQQLEAVTSQAQQQTSLIASLSQRLEETSNLLTTIQEQKNTVPAIPAIDENAIIDAVVNRLSGEFQDAMKRLEAKMERPVSVSEIAETPQIETNSSVPATSETRQSGTNGTNSRASNIVPLHKPETKMERSSETLRQSETETKNDKEDYKTRIYALLREDSSRQVADLVKLTGYPKTTVWRLWRSYHEQHGTRGMERIVNSSADVSTAVETTVETA